MSTTPHAAGQQRLHSYDLLRGLAILGVVAVHAGQTFPSNIDLVDLPFALGRYGVTLFYLVSALTMCHMWQQRSGEPAPVKRFYIRRVLRIAPLFWLAMIVYLLLNGTGPSYWAPDGIGPRHILLTATFLHGFWPDTINSVVPGGWSIAVEMTFYACFPWLIRMAGERAHVYLAIGVALWLLNVLVLQDALVDFLARHYHPDSTTIVKDFLYLNFFNQAPVFLVGCYLYFAAATRVRRTHLAILGLWLAVAACVHSPYGIKHFAYLAVVLALALLIWVCLKLKLELRSVERLGRHSYGIYLSHFLVLSMLHRLMPRETGLLALLAGAGLTLLLSTGLAVALHLLVERRAHRLASYLTRAPRAAPPLQA